ncbi:MAG: divalent-cation tolerance protein CutA [Pseudomonadota bacterium]|nr:divalent-cation tolerance protein CutA [Pseudomonadota bacterium]
MNLPNNQAPHLCMLYCTCRDQKEAEHIAATLIEEKLIACANILPTHTSIYHWQGELQQESEVAMFLKTRASLFARVSERITALHSYDTCCILKLNIDDCNQAYGRWLTLNTIN